ncbi:MAG: Fe(3+) ABC transporter substrate-binding protein [Halofilum sp. (in: g-proteobacteria)]
MIRRFISIIAASALLAPAAASADNEGEVNLYSARQESLILPLLEQFEEQTGIEVNLVTGSADALIERLEVEGRNTPADVLLTTDAGRLHRATEAGLLQGVDSDVLDERVPSHLRHPEGRWFGLSKRARVISYNRDAVDPSELPTYEALTDAKWEGEVCIRSSSNIYNQSLLASMIAEHGEEGATEWAEGVVNNMARRPQGGDTDQIRAVASGVCDVAVNNTYYYGRLVNSDDAEDRAVAEKVGLIFPNQDGRGTHVNVSGAGVTTHASNVDTATQLLEFLVSDEAQQWYAQVNYEYPVNPEAEVAESVEGWGYPFEEDDLPLARLGELNAEAVRIFDRAGWR